MSEDTDRAPAAIVRHLLRRRDRAALATLSVELRGAPYVSLVLVVTDQDLAPLMFVSRLAEHTRNMEADSRVALLFDGTEGLAVPLAGERVTLCGRVRPVDDRRRLERYLRYHPEAETYRRFTDFALWRVEPERAHLVAGFGRVTWIEADDLRLDTTACDALAAAEAEIIEHLNQAHADTLQLYAARLLGESGGRWRAIGVDPEGLDLAADGRRRRLEFPRPADGPDGVRAALIELARAARGTALGG